MSPEIRDGIAVAPASRDGTAVLFLRGRVVLRGRYVRLCCLRGRLLATDQPGFRERYGYHNDADHSQEQRYGF